MITLRALVMLPLFALANPGFSLSSSQLVPARAQELLADIDMLCGDTWCTGDYDFRFKALDCDSGSCSLDVGFWPRNDRMPENFVRDERNYLCRLEGLNAETVRGDQDLFDAVGRCLNGEIQQNNPLAYIPKASRCEKSLTIKPHFSSAAHSLYAEVFHEGLDPRDAALATVGDLIARYSEQDLSCELEWFVSFKDQITCKKVSGTGGPICELPSDTGRFVVIKDYVDSASVIFLKYRNSKSKIGSENKTVWQGFLPAPSACYSDLLNHGGLFDALTPLASGDHFSHYVSTRGLKSGADAISNGVELVRRAVQNVSRKAPATCRQSFETAAFDADSCFALGKTAFCVFNAQQAGYFIVTKDDTAGAYVTFARYD